MTTLTAGRRIRDRTRRARFVEAARRAIRYSAGRRRTAAPSRLTATKLPDPPTGSAIGGTEPLLQQIYEPTSRVAVLPRVEAAVELGDPVRPRHGQPGHVAYLGHHLRGGLHKWARGRLAEREQEPTHIVGV